MKKTLDLIDQYFATEPVAADILSDQVKGSFGNITNLVALYKFSLLALDAFKSELREKVDMELGEKMAQAIGREYNLLHKVVCHFIKGKDRDSSDKFRDELRKTFDGELQELVR